MATTLFGVKDGPWLRVCDLVSLIWSRRKERRANSRHCDSMALAEEALEAEVEVAASTRTLFADEVGRAERGKNEAAEDDDADEERPRGRRWRSALLAMAAKRARRAARAESMTFFVVAAGGGVAASSSSAAVAVASDTTQRPPLRS
jgi:hypothetical protein